MNRQLYKLVLNASAYLTINEARRHATKSEKGRLEISGLLHNLLDRCFRDSQLMAVRRLVDVYPLGSTGKRDKSVFSLTALLADLKEHAHLLTRENILAAEGLVYDWEALQEKESEFCLKEPDAAENGIWIPQEMNSSSSRERHESIDILANVSAKARSPQDVIRREIIDAIESKIRAACDQIELIATKFHAHPATPSSRESAGVIESGVTLNSLLNAHEVLCRSAQFISLHFVGPSQHYTFLPDMGPDPLRYLSKPLMDSSEIPAVRRFWNEQEEEIQSWQAWNVSDLYIDQVNDH